MAKRTRATLGEEYTDTITGFRGTAVFRQTTKNGCVRIGLQPRMTDDGKMPKVECLFETMIQTDRGARIESKADPKVLKLLGLRYVDPKTGFAGVATSHLEAINGHVQLGIEAPVKADGSMGESWNIDVQDLVEFGTEKKAEAPTPARGPLREQIR